MNSPMFELPDLNESFYITNEKQSFNALLSILYFGIDFNLQLFIFVNLYLETKYLAHYCTYEKLQMLFVVLFSEHYVMIKAPWC
jgi:hypothetical protein